jgi:uncharacterized protein
VKEADIAAIEAQLGREPRGLMAVAHRCPCGLPDVVETAPRLPDGTPFPTLYYLTCPRATAIISGLEASGLMRDMTSRLADPATRAAYEQSHEDYLTRRDAAAARAGLPPLPAGTQSAGGMPDRVKCLHALAAHELAVPGASPFGQEALAAVGPWWSRGPCVHESTDLACASLPAESQHHEDAASVPQTPHRFVMDKRCISPEKMVRTDAKFRLAALRQR